MPLLRGDWMDHALVQLIEASRHLASSSTQCRKDTPAYVLVQRMGQVNATTYRWFGSSHAWSWPEVVHSSFVLITCWTEIKTFVFSPIKWVLKHNPFNCGCNINYKIAFFSCCILGIWNFSSFSDLAGKKIFALPPTFYSTKDWNTVLVSQWCCWHAQLWQVICVSICWQSCGARCRTWWISS